MKFIKRKQSGFTLVEIAIVLVIIGLLLGGVLKGQEMIENAKIKNAINDMNGVTAAYNSYIDRFHTLPGDDGPLATLTARGGAWATVTLAGAPNDGRIVIAQGAVFTGGGEGAAFWQHLKASGFITGNPAAVGIQALPPNAFNGLTGVGTGITPAAGTAVFSICQSQVPGKSARAIDTQMDDGIWNKGSVLATLGAAGVNTPPGALAAAAYNDDNQYTICKSM